MCRRIGFDSRQLGGACNKRADIARENEQGRKCSDRSAVLPPEANRMESVKNAETYYFYLCRIEDVYGESVTAFTTGA